MAQQTINNGESGSSARSKINGNFTEVYNFGVWQDWTPTFGGFSVAPTFTARYCLVGKVLFMNLWCSAAGTSNATTFTVSLPGSYVCKTGIDQHGPIVSVVNNGTNSTTAGRYVANSGQTLVNLFRDTSGTSWTNTGGKRASFAIFIEID